MNGQSLTDKERMTERNHTADPILEVENLTIAFRKKKQTRTVVDQMSYRVYPGEILGIVGETGCGKSISSLAVLRLLPSNAVITGGRVLLKGEDLLSLSEKEMCGIRGNRISMIFQDPMTALNPTMTIGRQLTEPFMLHQGMNRQEAFGKAADMLGRVGITDPAERLRAYPHEFSGGMLQRVVIAMALACRPEILIADEPTTALDVTIQAQILELILELRDELNTAVILITHDMGVISETADRVQVLYAGQIVESGETERVFSSPRHPYTRALLRSIPDLSGGTEDLYVIPGMVPSAGNMPAGCRFADRCEAVMPRCRSEAPAVRETKDGVVRCHLTPGE